MKKCYDIKILTSSIFKKVENWTFQKSIARIVRTGFVWHSIWKFMGGQKTCQKTGVCAPPFSYKFHMYGFSEKTPKPHFLLTPLKLAKIGGFLDPPRTYDFYMEMTPPKRGGSQTPPTGYIWENRGVPSYRSPGRLGDIFDPFL